MLFLPNFHSIPKTAKFVSDFSGISQSSYTLQAEDLLNLSTLRSKNSSGFVVMGENYFFRSQWLNALNTTWSSKVQKELEWIASNLGLGTLAISDLQTSEFQMIELDCIDNGNVKNCG